jgi:ankyrin repeat protein
VASTAEQVVIAAGGGTYEELLTLHFSYDPCAFWQGSDQTCSMVLEAAQAGDLSLIRQLHANGVSIVSISDYDLRTAGHLACVEGNIEIVKYLKQHGANFSMKDRWGRTPMDDAHSSDHHDIIALLAGRAAAPTTPFGASGGPRNCA